MRLHFLQKIKASTVGYSGLSLPRMKAPEIYGAVLVGSVILLIALFRVFAH
jgi:hypothetical protein